MSNREKMIIEFYENGKLPLIFRIDMKIQELKYKWKHRKEDKKNEFRDNNMVGRSGHNTIYDNGNGVIRNNENIERTND